MRSRLQPVFLSLALVIALSVYGAAQEQSDAAMVRAAGTMSINGISVRNSSPLRSGDTLQSGPDSTAAISSKGVMILVFPNSTVLYSGRGLELKAGSIKVATASGIIAKVDSYEVTPYGSTVKFQLSKNGSCGSVSPERGTVVLRDGNKTNLVQAGTTTVFGEPSCAPPEKSHTAANADPARSHRAAYALMGVATAGTACVTMCAKISPDSPDD